MTVTIDDPDGDPSDIVVSGALVDPTLATVDVAGAGATRTITVTGATDAFGTTILQVGFSDGDNTALEFVPVTINPVNDAPTIAALDDVTIAQGGATTVQLTIDDVDDPVGALVILATTDPGGVATVEPSPGEPGLEIGTVPGAFGVTTVEVTVSDGDASASTSFELTVTRLNTAPIGVDDAYSVIEDGSLVVADPAFGLLANDLDAEGDALTATTYSDPSAGTLTGNPDGTFTYVPDADVNGTDTFTYVVSDGDLNAAPVTVTITVLPVNDSPTAALILSPPGGFAPLTVEASALGSGDPDSTVEGYLWDDDTAPSTVGTRTYVFPEAGEFVVTVRAVDDDGAISAPVSRTVFVTEPAADDATVEFELIWQPIVATDGSWTPPDDAVLVLSEFSGSPPIVVDLDTLDTATCPPVLPGSGVISCTGTTRVPASVDGYRIDYPALSGNWLVTTAADCARPDDQTDPFDGWFVVPVAASLRCQVTVTEFGGAVPANGALVVLQQNWVLGDGFTDGRAVVEIDDQPVTFPNEDCGKPQGDSVQLDGCSTAVAVQPDGPPPTGVDLFPPSVLSIDPADGWTVTLAGACTGPASSALFEVALGGVGFCQITYTWLGDVTGDALLDLTLVYSPIFDSTGEWLRPDDAVIRFDDGTGGSFDLDVNALSPGVCPPGPGSLLACTVTTSIASTTEAYAITYPALTSDWILTFTAGCEPPPDENRTRWFAVSPASAVTCEITATQFPDPVPDGSSLVELRQSWVTGSGFTDGSATIEIDGVPVTFPSENCGVLDGGGELQTAGCDTLVAVLPDYSSPGSLQPFSVMTVDPAPGWVPSYEGDCVLGSDDLVTFTSAPGSAGICDVTYTWVGDAGTGVPVTFSLTWDPVLSLTGLWTPPVDAVLDLREGPFESPILVDLDGLDTRECLSDSATAPFTCEATTTIPPSAVGYLISYPALGPEWLLTTSDDCAGPSDPLDRDTTFVVPAGSALQCGLLATEHTEPLPAGGSLVDVEFRWTVDGVAESEPTFLPRIEFGNTDVSSAFVACSDDPLSDGWCAVTVAVANGEIFVDNPGDGWTFGFGADCSGVVSPDPTVLVMAEIANFVSPNLYRCVITADFTTVVLPDLDASLTADPLLGLGPLEVTLDAGGSEPAGNIVEYRFTMSAVGEVPLTKTQSGSVWVVELPDSGGPVTWEATVEVLDDLGRTDVSAPVVIQVGIAGLQVNTTDEGSDTDPGDGVCWTGALLPGGVAACSFRAAIEETNALPGRQEILVPTGDYLGDLANEVVIRDDVAIVGEGFDVTNVVAESAGRGATDCFGAAVAVGE